MRQESDALLGYVKRTDRVSIGRFECKSFEMNGQQCLLITSGMGVRRAGEAAHELLKTITPRLLISFGIAGAVEADLEIGDVVIPEGYCELEHGTPGAIVPLDRWPNDVLEAVASNLGKRSVHLVTGTAITTGGASVVEDQVRHLQHPILEMETAGIAQAAAEVGAALLCIRAISDGPRAPLPVDLSEIMDEDANLRPVGMLKAFLRHPGMILQVGSVQRNSNMAAEHAALAVFEVLGTQDL
jgi:nucleoside phosphorylase